MSPSQSSVHESAPCSFNNGASCPDNDGNVCTRGSCNNALCVPVPADGAACHSDGDPCTEDECRDTVCRHIPVVEGGPCVHPPIVCPPTGDPCYHLECDNGLCWSVPDDGAECQDDGNPCTLDICADFQCAHPCKPDCDACGLGFCIDCECVACDTGEICCNGACCEPERCCGGECCATDCEGCLSEGSISGGDFVLAPPAPVLDDTMTFKIEGAVDTGGVKRVDCNAKTTIPPVTLDYQWILTKPSGATSSGTGAEAPVVADEYGEYVCTFDMMAERECPPAPRTISPHAEMNRARFIIDDANLSTDTLQLDLIESAVDAIPIVCEAGFDVTVGGSYSQAKVCCPNGAIAPATLFDASGSLSGTASIKWCLPGSDGQVAVLLPWGSGGSISYSVGPFVTTEVGGLSVEVGGTLRTAPCEAGCVTMQYSVPFGFAIGVGVEFQVWVGLPLIGEFSGQATGEVSASTGGFSVSGNIGLFGSGCPEQPVTLQIGAITAELSGAVFLYRDGQPWGEWNAAVEIDQLWEGVTYP